MNSYYSGTELCENSQRQKLDDRLSNVLAFDIFHVSMLNLEYKRLYRYAFLVFIRSQSFGYEWPQRSTLGHEIKID